MPIGITEEHAALHEAVRGWAERHCPPAVPRSLLETEREELPPFWNELAAQGWLGLHVDEALGGEGYGLPELVVVLEELGRAVAPGPFLPTVLTSAVVQSADKEVAAAIVPSLVSGDGIGAVTLDGALGAEETADGLRVNGTLRPVLAGHLATVIAAPTADAGWVVLTGDEFTATELPSLDLGRRSAEAVVDGWPWCDLHVLAVDHAPNDVLTPRGRQHQQRRQPGPGHQRPGPGDRRRTGPRKCHTPRG